MDSLYRDVDIKDIKILLREYEEEELFKLIELHLENYKRSDTE